MSALRMIAVAPGWLAVVLAVTAASSETAWGLADSPEAKLRARIADQHAEVALLEVESSAARSNLLESLKKLGQLELGDKHAALSKIRDEMSQLMSLARTVGFGDSKEFRELMQKQLNSSLPDPREFVQKMQRDAEKSADKKAKEEARLLADYLEGGDKADKALDRLSEIEYQSRLESARTESERMKADFLKKTRQLHVKKMELADAEAEYKATRS